MNTRQTVLLAIHAERKRQHRKFGDQSHLPDGTGTPSRVGALENARRRFDDASERGALNWRLILEEEVAEALVETDETKLAEELVQIAAVATAWAEALDKRSTRPDISLSKEHLLELIDLERRHPDECGDLVREVFGLV